MTRKDVVKFLGLLLSILIATIQSPMAQTRAAQQAASSVRFHHVHLNSVNPEAAAAYYPKAFTTSTVTKFNGYDAVKPSMAFTFC